MRITRRTILWIKVGTAAALLALMFILVKPARIWEALVTARLELVAAGAALMPLNLLLQEYKWRYLVRLVKPQARFRETLASLLGGMAFGVVTPGRVGEYGRALFIQGVPPLNLVGLTVIDKFYNLGATVAVGLPALMTLPEVAAVVTPRFMPPLLAFLALVNLVLLYLALDPRPVRSLLYALQLMIPRHNRIAQLVGGLDRFGAPQARVALALTLAHYLVYLVQYHLILAGFSQLPVRAGFQGAAAVLFTKSALPIAVGDLGLDQLVSAHFFGQFGATPEAAVDASLVMFAVNVLLPALAGLGAMGSLQLGSGR